MKVLVIIGKIMETIFSNKKIINKQFNVILKQLYL